MLRSPVFVRLYLAFVVACAVVGFAVDQIQATRIRTQAQESQRDELRTQCLLIARLVAPSLGTADWNDAVGTHLSDLAEAMGSDLALIDAQGRVRADSADRASAAVNQRSRPEVRGALADHDVAFDRRLRVRDNRDATYAAVPLQVDGQTVGVVRATAALPDSAPQRSQARRTLAFGLGALALLGGLAGALLLWSFNARLRRLTAAAEAVSAGVHDRRVPSMGADELGTLARAFNSMAEELRQRLNTSAKQRREVLAILKSMVEGVIAVDRDQRVVLINDRARRILDVPDGDIDGRPIWEISRVQRVADILDLVLRGAREARDEVALPSSPGDRALALHATQLRRDDESVAGAVVVMHDITGLRRLEQVRRDFVANVSHELKTPLTAIRGFVETLLDDDGKTDAPTRLRFLGKIHEHTERLAALVTDLLTLSRVESRGIPQHKRLLDLCEPIRASAGLLESRAEAKEIRLRLDLPATAVNVIGDTEMLRQVVDNLLDNAIQHTPTAGSIVLRLVTEDRSAVLEVRDNGVGMEPHDRDRIFERFYRVDRGRSRELGGTGLGLSIVKHVVLAHRGQVSVDSTPGIGSTFRVKLPLAAS
ncbi:MAG: ATP-binding protein [Planctomycetota bacterium]